MEKVNCAVCGAPIDIESATKIEYEGSSYFACGPHAEEFKSNPAKYAAKRE